MMRICEEKEIRIANDFYKNVCSCCGTIWIPGVNCRVRIRNPDNSGVRSKKHALRMSSTMFDGNSVTKKNYRLDPSNSSNIILLVR